MNEVTSKEKQCEDIHKALEHDRWDNLYCEGIFQDEHEGDRHG